MNADELQGSVSHALQHYVYTLLLGSLPRRKPRYVEIKPEMAAILDSNMTAILYSNIANTQDL